MFKLMMTLAACVLAGTLFGVGRFGCDRSMTYDTKISNIDSTTTPGATVSLAQHRQLAEMARSDANDAAGMFLLLGVGAGLVLMVGLLRTFLDVPPPDGA